jgi:hypothetical protein
MHPPGLAIPSVRGWLPGVDTKSNLGYVILPEGRHKSGVPYRWLNLEVQAPTPLPPDIAGMIMNRPTVSTGGYTSAGGFDISRVLSGLPMGERNDAIFRFCCWLRRQFRDDRDFVVDNAGRANARCAPPLDEAELHQCVESAFKQDHGTLSREANAWVKMLNAGEGWEEPIPLHSPAKLPPFPVHALPPVVKNWCEAVSHELQMPIELAAGLVFAVIATAFVGRVKIEVKPGWEEQGTLYVIGLSRPGTMKSALARRAFAPIVAAQKHMRTVTEEQIRHARARAEVLKAIVAALKKDLAKRPGDQDLRNQLEEAQFSLDAHEIPTLPVLTINDATPEALETVMSEQAERVSVLDSEGSGLETLLGARYGREGTSNLDLVLKAYSGSEPHDVRRVKRETKMIENPCMAIGGIVQPAIIEGIKGVSNTEERGFI